MRTSQRSSVPTRSGVRQTSKSGIQGGPVEYVSNGNDNLSPWNLQRDQHLPGVFNLTEELAPFVCPKRDETLTEVPKRDFNTSAKDRREAGIQQLSGDPQAVAVRTQLYEEIEFERFRSI